MAAQYHRGDILSLALTYRLALTITITCAVFPENVMLMLVMGLHM